MSKIPFTYPYEGIAPVINMISFLNSKQQQQKMMFYVPQNTRCLNWTHIYDLGKYKY